MQELFELILITCVFLLSIGLLLFHQTRPGTLNRKQKRLLWRISLASALLLFLQLIGNDAFQSLGRYGRWLQLLLYLIDYAIIGSDILQKAYKGILNRRLLDENFLMALATLGALLLAIFQQGEYLESIAVMLFYQIGEWFQSYAVGRSRRSIGELMDIRPDIAHLESNGSLQTLPPDQIPIGSIIVVQPGEKVPIDGILVEGHSTFNTIALTGESLPQERLIGQEVLSGSINLTGLVRIRTTRDFGESTVSKILELVENASAHKSKSEAWISRFARVYTPAVCATALLLAILPPLIQALFSKPSWEVWVYRGLSFLVASCPCALVISIPLTFFAGIGGASRAGILVKGADCLETLSQVRSVVWDKTGTLTQGVFEVTAIHHNQIEEHKLLEWVALAESSSSHPISKSLQAAYGKPIDHSRVRKVQEYSGNGVRAEVDSVEILAGNDKFMHSFNIPFQPCHSIGTVIHVAIDRKYAGHILISDKLKPSSPAAIQELRRLGIHKTLLLTGDNTAVAKQTADALQIPTYHAKLLPQNKVEIVESLLEKQPPNEKLAFVGDGINDAPVLRRSDIGIAMGGLGSDAAIEAADVVLMEDDPLQIARAIRISRKCLRIAHQNIAFSLVVKLSCLALISVGLASMWLAIFADVGVMILAILNAIRTLRVTK